MANRPSPRNVQWIAISFVSGLLTHFSESVGLLFFSLFFSTHYQLFFRARSVRHKVFLFFFFWLARKEFSLIFQTESSLFDLITNTILSLCANSPPLPTTTFGKDFSAGDILWRVFVVLFGFPTHLFPLAVR